MRLAEDVCLRYFVLRLQRIEGLFEALFIRYPGIDCASDFCVRGHGCTSSMSCGVEHRRVCVFSANLIFPVDSVWLLPLASPREGPASRVWIMVWREKYYADDPLHVDVFVHITIS
jgi:hypothetical protein